MLISTYTVEWTGTGSDERFEIDLYYCGSFCMEVCEARIFRGVSRTVAPQPCIFVHVHVTHMSSILCMAQKGQGGRRRDKVAPVCAGLTLLHPVPRKDVWSG